MSDSMEQFKVIFFEECTELLVSLEEGLMRLQLGEGDEETMHAVFRAVHSIKGGAGAFGFDNLVAFAHIQETMLDEIRSGTLEIKTQYIDVLLKAYDILGELVGVAQRGDDVGADYGCDVADAMRAIMEKSGIAQQRGEGAHKKTDTSLPAASLAKNHIFQISFKPFMELYQRANEPTLLIRELANLGTLTVNVDVSAVPEIDAMDAEHAYFSWVFRLITKCDRNAVLEVFEFVDGDCDLTVIDLGVYLSPDDFYEDEQAGLFAPLEDIAIKGEDIAIGAKDTVAGQVVTDMIADALPKKNLKQAKVEETVVSQSIRVELDKVDKLVNMVGELVITHAMLREQGSLLLVEQHPNLVQGIEDLSRHIRELQESVMAIRAQPVKSVFSRMPRLVRELTSSLNKKARLVMVGEETEVDKTVTERIGDPLMHMIRNSVDHGLELPEIRKAAGKDEEGIIRLSAFHRGGRIFIEIEDDGAGINRDVILKKAIANGLVTADVNLSDEEINNLIFLPGFSTAQTVTNVSGRGVGMDVVRKNIQSLGGRISISSTLGKGSKFSMSLPLTLAVMDGMVVDIGRERFVLPLVNIIQTLRPEASEVHRLPDGRNVMMFRDEYILLVSLFDVFGVEDAVQSPCEGLVVVVEGDGGVLMGFIVDDLVNQQQVVIKSLESNYELVEGISGATILGNGRVSLIVDIAAVQTMVADNNLAYEDMGQQISPTQISPIQMSMEVH